MSGRSGSGRPWTGSGDGTSRRTSRLDSYVPKSAQRERDEQEKKPKSSSSTSDRYSIPASASSGESSYERYLARQRNSDTAARTTSEASDNTKKYRSSSGRTAESEDKHSSRRSSDPTTTSSRERRSGRYEDRNSVGSRPSRSNPVSSSDSAVRKPPTSDSSRGRRSLVAEKARMFEGASRSDRVRSSSSSGQRVSSSTSRSSKQALEIGGSDKRADNSRELRARRLKNERKSPEKPQIPKETDRSKPDHYQAHAPAVEKYLARSHMIAGIRDGMDKESTPQPVPDKSVPEKMERRSSLSRQQELESKRLAREAEMAKLRQARQERDAQREALRTQASRNPEDETNKTTDAATSGWSTLRRSSTEGNNVDRYLAMRKRLGDKASSVGTPPRSPISPLVMDQGSVSSSSSSEEESVVEDESEEDPNEQEWSVRVSVISAIDFPASVVPNLPLSPILNFGLVGLGEATEVTSSSEIAKRVENDGMAALPKSRLQCTSAKVLTKRDNGSAEFHEELRWDRVKKPQNMALGMELVAKAVIAPSNLKESPPVQAVQPLQFSTPRAGASPGAQTDSIGSLFRRPKGAGEMETANAAAAVAQLLVNEGDASNSAESETGPLFDSKATNQKQLYGNHSETAVQLRRRKRRKRTKATQDLRLGSHLVALSSLPLKKDLDPKKEIRIEQWCELEGAADFSKSSSAQSPSSTATGRNPSILLEITISAPEALDDSEDDMMEDESPRDESSLSFCKRESLKIRNQLKQEIVPVVEKQEEPVLEPGLIDFICVVGARDIGDQKADDGSSGWVESTPACCILEQFPPNDEFHMSNGRSVVLPNKTEWFCLPEGCRLWRGSTPPNADELNLRRFAASSPSNISTSTAVFDANLGCTTSFSWFVIASNSDEYGSETSKTYGACIRFYVPAPPGIDPTQDDFAQMLMDTGTVSKTGTDSKRLWVPLGICLTSSLPIVGVMETMLLRLCEKLSSLGLLSFDKISTPAVKDLYEDLAQTIVNFQRPTRGVVNCSVPFITGERLHVSLPPRSGMPSLPHGKAITSVCRLLGADGVNHLLSCFLTEKKVLLHSDDVCNLCLVAEVITALMFPFQWSCPYVPVLPAEMMEFLEAPVSFILGIPSSNLKLVEPHVLEELVVVDLDNDFCEEDHSGEERKRHIHDGTVTPLPYAMSSTISRALQKLLRAEDEVENTLASSAYPGQNSPKLEQESVSEREFRLTVAVEVCSLLHGFQDCLVYASASRPVFDVDKFLETAPSLYEKSHGAGAPTPQSVELKGLAAVAKGVRAAQKAAQLRPTPPAAEAFLSCLVNCQHFHQLVETLDSENLGFFREIMENINVEKVGQPGSLDWHISSGYDALISRLGKSLQKQEDKIPTYRVKKQSKKQDDALDSQEGQHLGSFPMDLLQQIVVKSDVSSDHTGTTGGVKQLSLEYLVELEKTPWKYHEWLGINLGESHSEPFVTVADKVKLKDAIGERRFRAWKMAEHDSDDKSVLSEESRLRPGALSLDLGSLANSGSEQDQIPQGTDPQPGTEIAVAQKRIIDAKDRDILRRCLELTNESPQSFNMSERDLSLLSDAEVCLRNPAARQFLLTILGKRWQQGTVVKGIKGDSFKGQIKASSAGENLSPHAFEILVRIGCAMLDACFEAKDYISAYSLLKLTAGLQTTSGTESSTFVTARISLHPMYADLGLWEKVKSSHFSNRHDSKAEEDEDKAEHDAVVATLYEMVGYGIPAEELSRFSSLMARKNGWFNEERGQNLLLLARRLSLRRDQTSDFSREQKTTDLDMMSPQGKEDTRSRKTNNSAAVLAADGVWVETCWCHPAAQSSKKMGAPDKTTRRLSGTQNILNMLDEQKLPNGGGHNLKHMKRSAVTTMTYLGSSVVVTGGLDGGVFLARRVQGSGSAPVVDGYDTAGVCGTHLDWGSSGSRYSVGAGSTSLDGEYGVGSVSCLASPRTSHSKRTVSSTDKDVLDVPSEEELLSNMDGCSVVAGTTCGNLRVWAIKDVLSAVFFAGSGEEVRPLPNISPAGGRQKASTDFSAGSSLTRLKFSLRGRALSGHRGGVCCIDVPSEVYRPESIVSGGSDGLIKLWNLRSQAIGTTRRTDLTKSPASTMSPASRASRGGDALSILSGHGGRVLCVKTAWHGDRLLSGGADRTVRLWDIAGSSGKCLNALWGHFGWVTHVEFWGPNTIISASTDRSIALWDARVRNTPLFSLRHHYAPISSLLVGSRTDPIMVSAANDGTVAAWDFRQLSTSNNASNRSKGDEPKAQNCSIVRDPVATYFLNEYSSTTNVCGPLRLCRGSSPGLIQCLGRDNIVRDWDMHRGEVLEERNTGHCDTVSSFSTLQGDQVDGAKPEESYGVSSTITTSWDGTVRMRRLVPSPRG